jgi:hypothetical protein
VGWSGRHVRAARGRGTAPDLPISRLCDLYRRHRWKSERGSGNLRAPRSSGDHPE